VGAKQTVSAYLCIVLINAICCSTITQIVLRTCSNLCSVKSTRTTGFIIMTTKLLDDIFFLPIFWNGQETSVKWRKIKKQETSVKWRKRKKINKGATKCGDQQVDPEVKGKKTFDSTKWLIVSCCFQAFLCSSPQVPFLF
jgi:hypothetical protein